MVSANAVNPETDTFPIGAIIAIPSVSSKLNKKYWALCNGTEWRNIDIWRGIKEY